MRKKYFFDCEFFEFKKPVKFMGFKLEEINTINLISIGIVCEDGRELYMINKECDIEAIWKDDWLRTNVLPKVYDHLIAKESGYGRTYHGELMQFNLKGMKNLLLWHGSYIVDIANSICVFIYGDDDGGSGMSAIETAMKYEINDKSLEPDFYGYHSAYDFVSLCWIFGKMMTLPKGFPSYAKDLKHMLDDCLEKKDWYYGRDIWSNTRKPGEYDLQEKDRPATLEEKLEKIKKLPSYPVKGKRHDALEDAKWNLKIFNFINELSKIKHLYDK